MIKPLILLDNGHGAETPGKRSPLWSDGRQLFEYEFNRDIVSRISYLLTELKIEHKILVPETNDISLPERCGRANKEYLLHDKSAILFSIHANAGGGTGWECYTYVGQSESDHVATVLSEQAKKLLPEFKMRFDYSDGDPDKESHFFILKHTLCPAVLSENLFMDNKVDCEFLMSEKGRSRIAEIHVQTIKILLNEH